VEPSSPAERLLRVVEKVVKELREDYALSRRSGIIGYRERVYKEYYDVKPVDQHEQSRPVIFVDAGFHTLETDVIVLQLVNVGGAVRGEDGRLLYPPQLGDYDATEPLVLYGRWASEEGKEGFKVRIIPITDRGLLFTDERAEKVSEAITKIVNERSRVPVSTVKRLRLYRRLVKYLEQLVEIAYALKLQDLVGRHSLVFVDGTLARWFSVRYGLRFFDFDGLDILEALTGISSDQLKDRLMSVYGLVKQTKITSIARARWLFSSSTTNPLGLYTTTNPEHADRASRLINDVVRKKYGEEAGEELVKLFNRVIHPKHDVWVARFPLTTDGTSILHLEMHFEKPIISYREGLGAHPIKESAERASGKVQHVVEDLLACRTSISWKPPFGFMEVDEKVRIPTRLLHRLEDLFISVIRRETGMVGHPLEYLFDLTRKLRLGY